MNSIARKDIDRADALIWFSSQCGGDHRRFLAKIWIDNMGQSKECIETAHSASGSMPAW